MNDLLRSRIDGSVEAIRSLSDQVESIAAIGTAVLSVLRSGGTLYTAGNGGSAAQALHLAEELVGRYRSNRPPRPAICLNADPTALTCIANDFGFENVFSRPCEALLSPGDALIVLSTSGNSANIISALQAARAMQATTVGLLGNDGGEARQMCDQAVVVASSDSAFIQEAHQVVIHLICELIERQD